MQDIFFLEHLIKPLFMFLQNTGELQTPYWPNRFIQLAIARLYFNLILLKDSDTYVYHDCDYNLIKALLLKHYNTSFF